MNANELLEIGEHLQSLNDDNLAQRVLDGTEVQNFIGGSLEFLSRTRIRVTAEEKPTMEDADVDENVLAIDKAIDSHTFNIRIYQFVGRDPDRFPFWTSLPQLPEVTP